MSKQNHDLSRTTIGELYDRIVSILEQARSNTVRAVNSNMVTAYWLIGREILNEIQGGTKRAAYGKQIIEQLSKQLTTKYGPGFSVANLRNFRQFYEMYPDRLIHYPRGSELNLTKNHTPKSSEYITEFSPLLTWSHYRTLMRVAKPDARLFYEQEAISSGWDKRTLERQIHSCYYDRMLKSQNPQAMLQSARQQMSPYQPAVESLKNPYV